MKRQNHTPPDPVKLLSAALKSVVWFAAISTIALLIHMAFGDSITGRLTPPKGKAPQPISQEDASTRFNSDGTDWSTGLIVARGFEAVRNNCTNCHSAALITQNRATREGWHQMIRWMQETQGLWQLGSNEKIILDYLAENYAPQEKGRRVPLNPDEIEWYYLADSKK